MSFKGGQHQIDSLKTQITQLKRELAIDRKPVSVVSQEILAYCEEHKSADVMVVGVSDSHNPFQEKKSCSIT